MELSQIPEELLSLFTGLTILDLSDNHIRKLKPSQFQHRPQLQRLILSGNPLRRIEPSHFKGLEQLRHLFLDNCELQGTRPESFRDFLPHLETLTIDEK